MKFSEIFRNNDVVDSVTPVSLFPIKTSYELADDKVIFLKEFAKSLEDPHYPVLDICVEMHGGLQYGNIVYDEELQESLMKYPEANAMMQIKVPRLCNNRHEFKNGGGFLSIGLNFKAVDYAEKDVNGHVVVFEGNLAANVNHIEFRALKSRSVYAKYIFSNIAGDSLLGVFGEIYYALPNVREVKAHTIVYIVGENCLREVTLYDFGKYGNVLSSIDLKIE